MPVETLTLVATAAVAAFTGILAFFTWRLAKSTVRLANEAKEASIRQLGVETWLHLAARFDSQEIRRSRGRLAEKLESYDPSNHDDINEIALDVFEDIGTVFRLGLIDKDLADSSFSFYATRWWDLAKPYIVEERKRNDDDETLFSDFESFANDSLRPDEKIDRAKFVRDEKRFLTSPN